jgi:hypothetical protein
VQRFYQGLVRGECSLEQLGCAPAEEALLGPAWQQELERQVGGA